MTAVAVPLSTLVPRKQTFFSSRGERPSRLFGSGKFLDGEGLAGQAGLGEEEVFAGKQPQVGGDHVPGREFDHVAGNQLRERYIS